VIKRRFRSDCKAIVDDCEAIVKQLRGDYAAIVRRLRNYNEAIAIAAIADDRKAIVQQLRGSDKAIAQRRRSRTIAS